jgi:uncharacterized protein (DUF3084 family)
MDLSNGSGGIDSSKLVEYFSTQFLKDLGQMAALRDELAKRQGAMSAVEDAKKLRAEADAYAQSRQGETDINLAQAKEANSVAKALQASLDAREADLNTREGKLNNDVAAQVKAVEAHKQAVKDAEVSLQSTEKALKLAQDKLAADQAALDGRVKAFQDKVASINV